MENTLTTAAQAFAQENGVRCIITPGVRYDTTTPGLATVAEALLKRVQAADADLLALDLEGDTLVARVDDARADEPLCPAAFNRIVRQLSYDLLGQVWTGRLAPEPASPVATELTRVA